MDKAERFLRTAHLALENNDSESCVSRAYYALFHAVILLLEARGGIVRAQWKHTEVQRVFSEEFCKRGLLGFGRQDSDTLRDSFFERLRADYERSQLNPTRSKRILDRAHQLVNKIRGVVENGSQNQTSC